MKRKNLLFALLLAIGLPWVAMAQETLTVCDGSVEGTTTTTNNYVPIYGLYVDTQGQNSEFIIPAETQGMSDMEGGTISKLAFYIPNPPATWGSPTVQVYMGEVEGTTLSSLNGPTNFTTVWTGTLSNQSATMEITLSEPYTYEGGNLLIGMYVQTKSTTYQTTSFSGISAPSGSSRYNSGSGSGYAVSFLPKTTFTYEPAQSGGDVCEKPATLVAEDVTGNSATLTWTGGSGVYNIELNGTIIEENYEDYTYNLTGLAATTAYTAKVQSVCDGTTPTSTWKSVSFTTPCASYNIPYVYGFEDAAPFGCWTVISGNITRYSGTTNTGSYRLDFRGTTSNMIALPQFNEATNNLRVEFYTRPESTGGSSGKFAIGYMTDITDASTFVAVDTYNSTQMTTTYVKKTVDMVNVPANANIAMRQFDCSTNYYWYVDDVTVKEMPSCLAPTDLAANASTTSAELSWTANSGETAWTLYWKESGATDYTEVANATNPYMLNGLTAATNYEFYVVANCSADDASEPSEVFTFATACDVIAALGYSESFDNYAAGNNVLPTCWSYINTTTNSTYAVYPRVYANGSYSTYASSAPNCLYFYSYGSSDPQPQYAILPEMTGLNGKQVTLMAKGYNASSTFKIGTMSDPTDASTFTMIAEQTLTTSYPTDAEGPFEFIIPADCRDSYLAIMMDAAPSGYNTRGVYVDDITIAEAPTCLKPTELEATANALTATITWVSEVGEYEVAYATEATATPDENIAGTATEETYTMNDLALGDHYFWVRANCGSDGYSEWVGPVSVHIGYCVPTPSNVDGNGISNVTFGMGDNIVNNDTPKATYADYSSQIGAVQAGVKSTIAITYATGYDYGTIIWVDLDNSLSFEDSEIMFVGNAPNSTAPYNAAITIPATQTPGDYMMRIGGADSGFDNYISGSTTTAPSACYTGNWACFQDYTLRVLEAPSCLMPTGLAVNYTGGNTATVTWEGTAETYNIDVNGTVTNNVTTPYTLGNLEMATTYAVKVQANCEEEETSEWSNAVSFTTDLCLPENQCEISYSFYDQYDDSWNGAYMNIVDAATEEVLYELTMPDEEGPYEGSFNVCDGRDIQFVWVSGNYPNECGYEFTHNGETILEKGTGETAPSAGVVLTYSVDCGFNITLEKTIIGYASAEGNGNNYYLIASPLAAEVAPTTVGGMITDEYGTDVDPETSTYDLYSFDESEDLEWQNYRAASNFNLVNGQGYLYASKEGTTLTFTGAPYSGTTKEVTLQMTENENADFQGWNLVGNPFTDLAYIDRPFYRMDPTGTRVLAEPQDGAIQVMEGVFVIATEDEEHMAFSTVALNNDNKGLVLNLSQGRGNTIDRAIVGIGQGRTLPKFMFNPNDTKLYIPQNGKDYAVVRSRVSDEVPVNFLPTEDGYYNISVDVRNMNLRSLVLKDKVRNVSIDLLRTPNYMFKASAYDRADRFVLSFKNGNGIYKEKLVKGANPEDFSFYSNGVFVIDNEGEANLQVIDLNGRVLSSENIYGSTSIQVDAAPGIYLLRLTNGDNVKVQKVVVE